MSMAGYTKLFNSILASTIWREDDKTRIVWITLLAMADKNGVAEGSIPGLADLARVNIEEVESSLSKLMAPDPYSRTVEHDGRRIEKTDGGWVILNHAKYRSKMSKDERREYNRLKQREWREKHPSKSKSTRGQQKSITVNDSNLQSAMSAHTKAEASPSSPSEEGGKFADWFKTLLPPDVRLADGWRSKWASIYDSMIRIDSRLKAEIKAVCEWARRDEFWSSNFMSPSKLREKKDGIQYFDIFKAKMAAAGNGTNKPKPLPTAAELRAKQAALDAEIDKRHANQS